MAEVKEVSLPERVRVAQHAQPAAAAAALALPAAGDVHHDHLRA